MTLVKRLLLALLLVMGATAILLWWWARGSLPSLDGDLRMVGLHNPVEVLLDGHGVPHVYASGQEDAWFAAGVLHARDRLWQMELYRRAARGRLSEVLGSPTLRIDRRFATLELVAGAEAEWRASAPEVREALTRYADGVNAQMATMTGRQKPLEFQVLGFTMAPWTPVDSLAVGRLLAWRLSENHQSELVRHALAARFGADEALRLGGRYPPDAPTVMQGLGNGDPGLGLRDQASDVPDQRSASRQPSAGDSRRAEVAHETRREEWPHGLEWLAPGARRGNSNNWVLSGRRTASGRPLLANDPHLQVELPGVWYEIHLVAADLNVAGVSIPGTPFVILGHNAAIAWGMTNTGADVQDLFIERIDVGRKRSLSHGQWQPVTVRETEIPVRGEPAQKFEVWRTRHGVVFADVGLEWEDAPQWLTPSAERSGERRAFALEWDLTGETAGAFEALNRAGGWDDFVRAIERFAAPSQNFVYADIEGNIGYAMSGVLPIRSSGVGMLPSDGNSGEGEWSGTVAPSLLPRVLNPASGYITSSNNQIDRRWTGFITRDWAAPYRTTRLHQAISAATQVDLPKAAEWQNDVTGVAPSEVLSSVDSVIATGKKRDGDSAAIALLEQLRDWDKRVDDRDVVTLYHLFEDQLWRRTFIDEMGEPLFAKFYEWAGAERPAGLYAIVNDAQSKWFDDIGTIDRRESRADVFLLAAADAARRYAEEFRRGAAWSAAHAVNFHHPLGDVAALGWVFDRGPSPMIGDATTVMRVSYNRLRPFAGWEIPSWRQLFDVGAWDDSRVVLPAGQSGHPLSPHYFDQNEMWRQGQYRPQPFSRTAVDNARAHRLLLLP